MTRLGVLVSGRGTNLEAILRACDEGSLRAEVAAVLSNRKCHAMDTAVAAHVPLAKVFALDGFDGDAGARDGAMADALEEAGVDLVVCAGYDRILHEDFVSRFRGRILNVHPSLLPAFGGSMSAIAEALAAGVKETGVTIHYIEPSTVDAGTIVAQEAVPVLPDDTVETLEKRVHDVEHRLYPATIQAWIDGRVPRPAGATR
ncbi:MAG: phosphoribosylglycinamide formyltransferase [Candidatus Dormibacteraeota bacterium]|nr:phosphoribosylglycinamide formyltransferase [Candidatus Dormibacteraeota bacterium]